MVAQDFVEAGTFGDEVQFLEIKTERKMVDADNLLFQANKLIANGQTLQADFFQELSKSLLEIKRNSENMGKRLEQLGIMCGGAQMAYIYQQKLQKVEQQVLGVIESIQDIKQQ